MLACATHGSPPGHAQSKDYLAVYVQSPSNFGGFFPDIPGCVTTGSTLEQVKERLQDALQWHLEAMLEDGEELPKPLTSSLHGPEVVSCVKVSFKPA